ncbi:MAG: hypothetical protein KKG21_02530, partial [Candidatus Omnitrophica bacterium]|nr:hypothetical protein [Candidatus Omnitrophota bacterium]
SLEPTKEYFGLTDVTIATIDNIDITLDNIADEFAARDFFIDAAAALDFINSTGIPANISLTNIHSISFGKDLWGGLNFTTTINSDLDTYGSRALWGTVTSTTIGTDAFGSSYESITITENDYQKKPVNNITAYVIDNYTVTTHSESTDVFGGSVYSVGRIKYQNGVTAGGYFGLTGTIDYSLTKTEIVGKLTEFFEDDPDPNAEDYLTAEQKAQALYDDSGIEDADLAGKHSISFGKDLWGGISFTTTINSDLDTYGSRANWETVASTTEGQDAFGSSYTSYTRTENTYAKQEVSFATGVITAYVLDYYTVTTTSQSNDIFGGAVYNVSKLKYINDITTDSRSSDPSKNYYGLDRVEAQTLTVGLIEKLLVDAGFFTDESVPRDVREEVAKQEARKFLASTGLKDADLQGAFSVGLGKDLWGSISFTTTINSELDTYGSRANWGTVASTTEGQDAFGSNYTSYTRTVNTYDKQTVDFTTAEDITAYVLDYYTVTTASSSTDIFGGSVYSYSNLKYDNGVTTHDQSLEPSTEYFGLDDVTIAEAAQDFFVDVTIALAFINSIGITADDLTGKHSISFGEDLWGGISFTTTINSDLDTYGNRALWGTVASTTEGYDAFGSNYTSYTRTENIYAKQEITLNESDPITAYVLDYYTVTTASSSTDIFGGDVYSYSKLKYDNDVTSYNNEEYFGLTATGVTIESVALADIAAEFVAQRFFTGDEALEDANAFITSTGITEGDLTNKHSISFGKDLWGGINFTTTINNTTTVEYYANRALWKDIEITTIGTDAFGSSYTTITDTHNKYTDQVTIDGNIIKAKVIDSYTVNTVSTSTDVFGGTVHSLSNITYQNGEITEGTKKAWGLTEANYTTYNYETLPEVLKDAGLDEDEIAYFMDEHGIAGDVTFTGAISVGQDIFGGKSVTLTTYEKNNEGKIIKIHANRAFFLKSVAKTIGYDVFGSTYSTTTITTNTYKTLSEIGVAPEDLGLAQGSDPLVLLSYTVETDSTSNDIFGGEVQTKSNYTYTNSVLTKAEVEAQFTDLGIAIPSGARAIWGLKIQDIQANEVKIDDNAFTGTLSVGTDLWGAESVTTTINTYIVLGNRALVKEATATTKGTDAFGSSYTTITITNNNYQEKPITIDGEQITAYVIDDYTVKTVSCSTDIFGGDVYSYSNLTYDNDVTSYNNKEYFGLTNVSIATILIEGENPRPITLQDIADEFAAQGFFINAAAALTFITSTGFTADKLTGEHHSISFGQDLFGGVNFTTTINNTTTVEYYANRALWKDIETTTVGTDAFGSDYTTYSTTINNYLPKNITINGITMKGVLLLDNYIVTTTTRSSDLFGGEQFSYSYSSIKYKNNKITHDSGREYWGFTGTDEMENIVEYNDMVTELANKWFDGVTEEARVEEARVLLGKFNISGNADLIINGERAHSVSIGTDAWGASSVTLSLTTEWDTLGNRPIALEVKSSTTGGDMFGSNYTSTTTVNNRYDQISWNINGVDVEIWAIQDSYSVTETDGSDISGNTYYTKTGLHTIYGEKEEKGRAIWTIIEAREGYYEWKLIGPSPAIEGSDALPVATKWAIRKKVWVSGTHTTGSDIFGNSYTSYTHDTEYVIYANRAFVKEQKTTSEGTSVDGSASTTNSWVKYIYDPADYYRLVAELNGEKTEGGSITTGSDIFGNSYTSTTINTYDVKGGKAVVTDAFTFSESSTIDGSKSYTFGNTRYDYGETDNIWAITDVYETALDLANDKITVTLDDGTETEVSIWDYLTNGEYGAGFDPVMLSYLGITEDTVIGVPGQTGGTLTIGTDLFGNLNCTMSHTDYKVVANGQWKPEYVTTLSRGQGLDGSLSVSISKIEHIYGDHVINGRTYKGIWTGTEDVVVNMSDSSPFGDGNGAAITWWGYLKGIFGDAVDNIYLVRITNYLSGLGLLDGVSDQDNDGDVDADDYAMEHGWDSWNAWCEYTEGCLEKGGEGFETSAGFVIKVESYILQGKVTDTNGDGEITVEDIPVEVLIQFLNEMYGTEKNAPCEWDRLAPITETETLDQNSSFSGSVSIGTDIFGNLSVTVTSNTYALQADGKVKVTKSTSTTFGYAIDGSWSKGTQTIEYSYTTGEEGRQDLENGQIDAGDVSSYLDSEGKAYKGLLLSVTSDGEANGADMMGNAYNSTTTYTYIILAGRPLVKNVTTDTYADDLLMLDWQNHTVSDTTYYYIGESGINYDPQTGEISYRQKVLDRLTGEVKEVIVTDRISSEYSGYTGVLLHVTGQSVTTGMDSNLNDFTSVATLTYMLIDGKPKVSSSVTVSHYTNDTEPFASTDKWITTTVSYEYVNGTETQDQLAQSMYGKNYSDLEQAQIDQVNLVMGWQGVLKHAEGTVLTQGLERGNLILNPINIDFDNIVENADGTYSVTVTLPDGSTRDVTLTSEGLEGLRNGTYGGDFTGTITFEIINGQAKIKTQDETLVLAGRDDTLLFLDRIDAIDRSATTFITRTKVTHHYDQATGKYIDDEDHGKEIEVWMNGYSFQDVADLMKFCDDAGIDMCAVKKYYEEHTENDLSVNWTEDFTTWLNAIVMYLFRDEDPLDPDAVVTVKVKATNGSYCLVMVTRDDLAMLLQGSTVNVMAQLTTGPEERAFIRPTAFSEQDIQLEISTQRIYLNQHTITHEYGWEYDNKGRLTAYKEKIWSNASPSIHTYKEHSMSYKKVTLISSDGTEVEVYKIKDHHIEIYKIGTLPTQEEWTYGSQRRADWTPRGGNVIDTSASDQRQIIDMTDIEYDDFGRMKSYKETVKQGDLTITNQVTGINYNSYGQITSRTTETWRKGKVWDEKKKEWLYLDDRNKTYEELQYNGLGQVIYSHARVTPYKWCTDDAGRPKALTPYSKDTYYTYNSLGQISSTFEQSLDSETLFPYFAISVFTYTSFGEIDEVTKSGYGRRLIDLNESDQNPLKEENEIWVDGFIFSSNNSIMGNVLDAPGITESDKFVMIDGKKYYLVIDAEGNVIGCHRKDNRLWKVFKGFYRSANGKVTVYDVTDVVLTGGERYRVGHRRGTFDPYIEVYFTSTTEFTYNSLLQIAGIHEIGTLNEYNYEFWRVGITYDVLGQVTGYTQYGTGAESGSGASLKDAKKQNNKSYNISNYDQKYNKNGELTDYYKDKHSWKTGTSDTGDKERNKHYTIDRTRNAETGQLQKIETRVKWNNRKDKGDFTYTTKFSYDGDGVLIGKSESDTGKVKAKWTTERIAEVLAMAILTIIVSSILPGAGVSLFAGGWQSLLAIVNVVGTSLITTGMQYLMHGTDKQFIKFMKDEWKPLKAVLFRGIGEGFKAVTNWLKGGIFEGIGNATVSTAAAAVTVSVVTYFALTSVIKDNGTRLLAALLVGLLVVGGAILWNKIKDIKFITAIRLKWKKFITAIRLKWKKWNKLTAAGKSVIKSGAVPKDLSFKLPDSKLLDSKLLGNFSGRIVQLERYTLGSLDFGIVMRQAVVDTINTIAAEELGDWESSKGEKTFWATVNVLTSGSRNIYEAAANLGADFYYASLIVQPKYQKEAKEGGGPKFWLDFIRHSFKSAFQSRPDEFSQTLENSGEYVIVDLVKTSTRDTGEITKTYEAIDADGNITIYQTTTTKIGKHSFIIEYSKFDKTTDSYSPTKNSMTHWDHRDKEAWDPVFDGAKSVTELSDGTMVVKGLPDLVRDTLGKEFEEYFKDTFTLKVNEAGDFILESDKLSVAVKDKKVIVASETLKTKTGEDNKQYTFCYSWKELGDMGVEKDALKNDKEKFEISVDEETGHTTYKSSDLMVVTEADGGGLIFARLTKSGSKEFINYLEIFLREEIGSRMESMFLDEIGEQAEGREEAEKILGHLEGLEEKEVSIEIEGDDIEILVDGKELDWKVDIEELAELAKEGISGLGEYLVKFYKIFTEALDKLAESKGWDENDKKGLVKKLVADIAKEIKNVLADADGNVYIDSDGISELVATIGACFLSGDEEAGIFVENVLVTVLGLDPIQDGFEYTIISDPERDKLKLGGKKVDSINGEVREYEYTDRNGKTQTFYILQKDAYIKVKINGEEIEFGRGTIFKVVEGDVVAIGEGTIAIGEGTIELVKGDIGKKQDGTGYVVVTHESGIVEPIDIDGITGVTKRKDAKVSGLVDPTGEDTLYKQEIGTTVAVVSVGGLILKVKYIVKQSDWISTITSKLNSLLPKNLQIKIDEGFIADLKKDSNILDIDKIYPGQELIFTIEVNSKDDFKEGNGFEIISFEEVKPPAEDVKPHTDRAPPSADTDEFDIKGLKSYLNKLESKITSYKGKLSLDRLFIGHEASYFRNIKAALEKTYKTGEEVALIKGKFKVLGEDQEYKLGDIFTAVVTEDRISLGSGLVTAEEGHKIKVEFSGQGFRCMPLDGEEYTINEFKPGDKIPSTNLRVKENRGHGISICTEEGTGDTKTFIIRSDGSHEVLNRVVEEEEKPASPKITMEYVNLAALGDSIGYDEVNEANIVKTTAKYLKRESEQFNIIKAIKIDEGIQLNVIVDKDSKVIAFTFIIFGEEPEPSAKVVGEGMASFKTLKSSYQYNNDVLLRQAAKETIGDVTAYIELEALKDKYGEEVISNIATVWVESGHDIAELPSFITDIVKAAGWWDTSGLSEEAISLFTDSTKALLKTLPAALKACKEKNLTPSQITDIVKAADPWPDIALKALPAALEAGFTFSWTVTLITDITIAAGMYAADTALFYTPDLLILSKSLRMTSSEARESILFVVKYGSLDIGNMWYLARELKIDLRQCTTPEGLAQEFAKKLNEYGLKKQGSSSSFEYIFNRAAVMIDKLHDAEAKLDNRDSIRDAIVEALDTRSSYYLIALAGASLYPSTFDKIFENKIKPDISSFIDEVEATEVEATIDPEGTYAVDFMLSLAGYNLVKDVIKEIPEYLIRTLYSAVKDQDNIVKNSSLLTSIFTAILTDPSLSQYKEETEDLLIVEFKRYAKENNIEGFGAIGYQIKLNSQAFSKKNQPEVNEICRFLPEIMDPSVPIETWLKDITITAVLRFRTDEKWFIETMRFFDKVLGFSEPKEIEEGKTWELSKVVNGVILKIIVTINDDYKNEKLDIFCARSHIYHNEGDVHAGVPESAEGILIYLGGCNSYGRVVADLSKRYPGNYLISDENTGEGRINNEVLYCIMESVANGEKSWSNIKNYVNKKVETDGIVYPHDKSMLIFDFIERIKAGEKQTGMLPTEAFSYYNGGRNIPWQVSDFSEAANGNISPVIIGELLEAISANLDEPGAGHFEVILRAVLSEGYEQQKSTLIKGIIEVLHAITTSDDETIKLSVDQVTSFLQNLAQENKENPDLSELCNEIIDKFEAKSQAQQRSERKWIELAEKAPGTALYSADKYKDQPYAQRVIEIAAEKDPWTALEYADKYIGQPYAQRVIETAAEKNPRVALYYADRYIDQSCAQKVIKLAAETAAEKDPWAAFWLADKYIDQPYAQRVIEAAAEKNPWKALEFADKYIDQPYAQRVIETAAERDPRAALEYTEILKDSKKPAIRVILTIKDSDYSKREKERISILLHEIVLNKMTLKEAYNIVRDNKRFFEALVRIKAQPNHLGEVSVDGELKDICLRKVQSINDLHNEPDEVRFASVNDAGPQELYTLMVYGQEEIFTSS